ncbi:hypothetical protein TRAPUB_7624 [Trametes pubescens]|uniref:Uncharacterized protein n=1 Tax=Trametes pubescens TaxID=154538 RepID=A0A1M2V2U2_TRAPU|nr:hypothetical protein TRAPUB_7624 [Trametes pubescens]
MYPSDTEERPKSRLFSLGILPTALPAPPCYPARLLPSNPEYAENVFYERPGEGVSSAPAPRLKGGPGCNGIVRVGDVVHTNHGIYYVDSLSFHHKPKVFAATVYQLVRVPTLRRKIPLHQLPRKFHIMFGEMELCAISPSKELMTSEFTRHATTTVFDPAIISLPFNDLPFVYLRRNVFLHEVRSRAEKTSYYVLKNRNRVDICPGTCDFGHIYGPDIDILRYCYHCERWLHARCLDPVCDEHVDELLARDLQWKLPSNPTRTDLLWWFLVSGPIERKPLSLLHPGCPGIADKKERSVVKATSIPSGWEIRTNDRDPELTNREDSVAQATTDANGGLLQVQRMLEGIKREERYAKSHCTSCGKDGGGTPLKSCGRCRYTEWSM